MTCASESTTISAAAKGARSIPGSGTAITCMPAACAAATPAGASSTTTHVRGIGAELGGGEQEDVRRRLAVRHPRVVAEHDHGEDREPVAMLRASSARRGAARSWSRPPAERRAQRARRELAGARHRALAVGNRRSSMASRSREVLVGRDRQARACRPGSAPSRARGRPIMLPLIDQSKTLPQRPTIRLRDLGVEALGIEQHAVHVEDDVGDRPDQWHGVSSDAHDPWSASAWAGRVASLRENASVRGVPAGRARALPAILRP